MVGYLPCRHDDSSQTNLAEQLFLEDLPSGLLCLVLVTIYFFK